jgi:hypothetical protein
VRRSRPHPLGCAWPRGRTGRMGQRWPLRWPHGRAREEVPLDVAGSGVPLTGVPASASGRKGIESSRQGGIARQTCKWQGQNNHLNTWVPHVRLVDLLSSNRSWTEWHLCLKTFLWHVRNHHLF